MSLFLPIHPDNPQARLIKQAADIFRQGGIGILPTDAAYVIGCHLDDKTALQRIQKIRQLDKHHHFTLMCRDLSHIATYAKIDNAIFRLLKSYTPGPYTFLLNATPEVPRRLQHPKRKTIGIRVPDCPIVQALLLELQEPLMITSLILPQEEYPLTDPVEIHDRCDNLVDIIIDGGYGDLQSTSVIDLYHSEPKIIRAGKGDVTGF